MIDKLSVEYLTYSVIEQSTPLLGGIVHCNFFMQEKEFNVQAEILSVQQRNHNSEIKVLCRLIWSDHKNRDQLNLKLHHCTWYRTFVWNGGYFKTPLELANNIYKHLSNTLCNRKITDKI